MAEQKIRKTGYLWKQGGSFKNWKVRYFVLRENCLEYYKEEKDEVPKGTIDLKTGRGVRTRDQCDLEWPDKAKPGRCFGLAVESRTFFFYGDDRGAVEDWMSSIQELITKVGTPSSDCTADALSNSETKASKAMRSGARIMKRMKKLSKQKGNKAEQKNPISNDDGTAAASGSSSNLHVEEFYDDVAFDENEALEDVYDDVEVSDPGGSDDNASFSASTEVYENVAMGTKPWNSDKSNSETFEKEVTVEPPIDETIDDEFDDDDSFTSEIYENI